MKATQSVGVVLMVLLLSILLWNPRILMVAILLGIGWFLEPIFEAAKFASKPESVVESYFEDVSTNTKRPFPILVVEEQGSKTLSVIVPAYKEERRLPRMLEQTTSYLEERERRDPSFTWEIIVVDDGSPDNTYRTALSYSEKIGCDKLRVLKLARNHGKGGAVKKGMLRARGNLLLMADADGATTFSELEKLEKAMSAITSLSGDGVVFGSRAHLAQSENLRRGGLRGFVSTVFQTFVSILVPGGIQDTQCGFKLFSRGAARKMFPSQKFHGWAFDCELLFLARTKFKFPVSEAAVEWVDVDGSKLSVADASLEMARDILLMSLMYNLRLW